MMTNKKPLEFLQEVLYVDFTTNLNLSMTNGEKNIKQELQDLKKALRIVWRHSKRLSPEQNDFLIKKIGEETFDSEHEWLNKFLTE